MKHRCLLAVEASHFDLLFGPAEIARLRELVALIEPAVSPASLPILDGVTSAGTELIVSSWGMPGLTADLLARFPRLRAVFHAAGTVKAIATGDSWARGIRITSAAGENAKPTAEFAFAQIILSLKRAWANMRTLKEEQHHEQHDPLVPGAYGSTVGLLSLGKTGQLVARRLATLDVQVIAYDPVVTPVVAHALGVRLCSLEEIFARANVVSCHTPLSAQTEGLVTGAHFAAMKPGAVFVNTARGGLVRHDEMIAVLRARPDLYAVLDVTEPEPPPPGSPLYALPNVILTPHLAGSLGPECRRLGLMMLGEVERYVRGLPLIGEVRREEIDFLA